MTNYVQREEIKIIYVECRKIFIYVDRSYLYCEIEYFNLFYLLFATTSKEMEPI